MCAAGPKDTGDPEDLAAMKREGNGPWLQRTDFENRLAASSGRTREQIPDRLTDHQRHDVVVRRRCGVSSPGVSAIAKDDEAIGNGLHFFNEMRNVDDGVSLRFQVPQEIEQVFDISSPEAAGRLVEHEYPAANRDRTGN